MKLGRLRYCGIWRGSRILCCERGRHLRRRVGIGLSNSPLRAVHECRPGHIRPHLWTSRYAVRSICTVRSTRGYLRSGTLNIQEAAAMLVFLVCCGDSRCETAAGGRATSLLRHRVMGYERFTYGVNAWAHRQHLIDKRYMFVAIPESAWGNSAPGAGMDHVEDRENQHSLDAGVRYLRISLRRWALRGAGRYGLARLATCTVRYYGRAGRLKLLPVPPPAGGIPERTLGGGR
jgi:hypothetical protein